MIQIKSSATRIQENFWSHCLFHPTDAIEDPWGKRILDRIAKDKSIKTIRIYSMFEDIVYYDEDGVLCYDFRVSDVRLDYLVENGFELLIAFAGMPDCIARTTKNKTTMAKGKTRYKGKMFNTSPPKDYAVWEELCYTYTAHLIERYGIDTVSKWHFQCFNEPDLPGFFMSELPIDAVTERVTEYCKLYRAFQSGVRRASELIPIGGPALAFSHEFLGEWLEYVKTNNLKLDFISVHNYGTNPRMLNSGKEKISINNMLRRQEGYMSVIRSHGFEKTKIIIDEWGFSSSGFLNKEDCPHLMAREHEVFSAFYAKLIHQLIHSPFNMERLFICLSGQHEMVEDFTGFRNFFTLNFIAKPIYNAYLLASRLGEMLLDVACDNENIFVIPTKCQDNSLAVLFSYSSENFEENLPTFDETVTFADDIKGKIVTLWCIDKETTNPYRMYQKMNVETPDDKQLKLLREEGKMKPISEFKAENNSLTLKLSPNATYLITVK